PLEVEQLEVVPAGQQRLGGGYGVGKVEDRAVVDAVGLQVVRLEAEEEEVEIEDGIAEARVLHEAAGDIRLGERQQGVDGVVGAQPLAAAQEPRRLVDPPAPLPLGPIGAALSIARR